ncbi:hypothetical protein D0S45_08430 [Marinifilum sp. JC120]|nr:hypothetical protein D0S45_08430 [Marinifilum sp. JC120]
MNSILEATPIIFQYAGYIAMVLGIFISLFTYKNKFGRKSKYKDDYFISKELLKENRWKEANDLELQLWYRAFTKKLIDARTIRYMLNFNNPLMTLKNYAKGHSYTKEEIISNDYIRLSFNNKNSTLWNYKWQIRFYTLLYALLCLLMIISFVKMNFYSSSISEFIKYFTISATSFAIAFILPLNKVWALRDAKKLIDDFASHNQATLSSRFQEK